MPGPLLLPEALSTCRTFPSTHSSYPGSLQVKASKKPVLQSRLLTGFYGLAESEIKTLQLAGKTQWEMTS